jgi:hypothetical protein
MLTMLPGLKTTPPIPNFIRFNTNEETDFKRIGKRNCCIGTVAAPTNSDSVTNKKCWLCNMVLKLKFIKCHPTERKSVAYKIKNLKN